jgi:hypothetical protein
MRIINKHYQLHPPEDVGRCILTKSFFERQNQLILIAVDYRQYGYWLVKKALKPFLNFKLKQNEIYGMSAFTEEDADLSAVIDLVAAIEKKEINQSGHFGSRNLTKASVAAKIKELAKFSIIVFNFRYTDKITIPFSHTVLSSVVITVKNNIVEITKNRLGKIGKIKIDFRSKSLF